MEETQRQVEIEIKDIVKQNVKCFSDLQYDQISLKRLTGLTNQTFRVEIVNDKDIEKKELKKILFRRFGKAEGLIDQEKEHSIFMQLGEQGLGPKCFAYEAKKWRIEEFIEKGIHPNNKLLKTQKFRNLLALYVAKFHTSGIQIKADTPYVDKTIKNKDFFDNVRKAASRVDYYDEKELEQLDDLLTLLEPKSLNFLEKIKPTSKLSVCHNDLNNLNIFYREGELEKQLLFIDYEYCEYNYVAYDIANFMNENTLNYECDCDPFFKYESQNFFSEQQIKDFANIYQYTLENLDGFTELDSKINSTSGDQQEIQTYIQEQIKSKLNKEQQKEYEQTLYTLVKDIEASRIISQWYWSLWGVLTSKPDFKMDFNHIEYGYFKFEQFNKLKSNFIKKYNVSV